MVGTLGWVWVGHHHVARCLRRLMLEAIACIEQDLFFSGQKMSFPPAFLPSSSTQMRRRSLIRMSCSHRRAREPGGAISSDVGMATENLWAATSENHGPQTKNMFISQGCGLNWEYVPLLLKLATWLFFQAGKWQLQSCCNDDAMNKFVLNMAAVTRKSFSKNIPSPIQGVDNGMKPLWMEVEPHKPHSRAQALRPKLRSCNLGGTACMMPGWPRVIRIYQARSDFLTI